MLCDRCKKNPASVYMQQIVNGLKVETNLCQECASNGDLSMGIDNFFQGLLGSLLASNITKESGSIMTFGDAPFDEQTCPNCKMTQHEFRDKGRFGCVQCYEVFGTQLLKIFGSIQTHNEHSGKIPHRSGAGLNLARKLEDLRRQQQDYVAAEEYERAAAIRDEIRQLENNQNNNV